MHSLRFFLKRWPPCTKRLRADFEKNRFFSFIWWPSTMRAQRGLILLLLLLAVFCSTAVSLTCYNCRDPVSSCNITTTCSSNQDSCLHALSGQLVYRRCWKRSECKAETIMDQLEVTKVKYTCCQLNYCNKNEGSLGKTALPGISVLVAILNLCFLSHL